MNQTCPQCGSVVGDRGLHGEWHREMQRQLASLVDAHRSAACHEATQDRDLARA